jgi:hypothetical protein
MTELNADHDIDADAQPDPGSDMDGAADTERRRRRSERLATWRTFAVMLLQGYRSEGSSRPSQTLLQLLRREERLRLP